MLTRRVSVIAAGGDPLIAYGGYRLVRFVYRLCFCPTSHGAAQRRFPLAAKVSRPMAAGEAAVPAFVIKPLAVRATELIGSLLAAAAVTAAMCVVMLLIETYRGMPLQIEQCAWLYLVSLAGAWCVLTVAKFWEGSRGERLLRHFILMILGLRPGPGGLWRGRGIPGRGCPATSAA